MRRISIALMVLLMAAPLELFSQNTLTVFQKDGQTVSFGFSQKPVVTFTDSSLVVTSTETQVEYLLSKVQKFVLTEDPTKVNQVQDELRKPVLVLDDYQVNISGAKPDATVRVLSADGKELATYKTDSEGSVTFTISELPVGTYIIRSNDLSFKILKI